MNSCCGLNLNGKRCQKNCEYEYCDEHFIESFSNKISMNGHFDEKYQNLILQIKKLNFSKNYEFKYSYPILKFKRNDEIFNLDLIEMKNNYSRFYSYSHPYFNGDELMELVMDYKDILIFNSGEYCCFIDLYQAKIIHILNSKCVYCNYKYGIFLFCKKIIRTKKYDLNIIIYDYINKKFYQNKKIDELTDNDECKGPFIVKNYYNYADEIYIHAYILEYLFRQSLSNLDKNILLEKKIYNEKLFCFPKIIYQEKYKNVIFSDKNLLLDVGVLSSCESEFINLQMENEEDIQIPCLSSNDFINLINFQIDSFLFEKADYLLIKKERMYIYLYLAARKMIRNSIE